MGEERGRRVIKASEILAKIEQGESVEYYGVVVEGDLDISGLDLPTVHEERTEEEKRKAINSQITISNSEIQGKVNFRKAQFQKPISFGRAKFDGNADFVGAKFDGDANFGRAKFDRRADFFEAEFGGDANFESVEFGGYAAFLKAEFTGGGAYFQQTKFGENAGFEDAKFTGGDANFGGAKFGGYASFIFAKFTGGTAYFIDATFEKGLNLVFLKYGRIYVYWDSIKDKLDYSDHVYLGLIKNFKDIGRFRDADDCYYQYRKKSQDLKKFHSEDGVSKLWDILSWASCGYGVRPIHTIICMFSVVFISSIIFLNPLGLFESFYFNIMTFTSGLATFTGSDPGYTLTEWMRFIAMIEAILGYLFMALFVVVLARKFIR